MFAKKHGGDFILRIEDTDSERYVPGAEDYIIEALKWCGITPNEGIGFGDGQHGPYRQSERNDIYDKYIEILLDTGHAYYAFDTEDELDARRKSVKNFSYNARTRMVMKNSESYNEHDWLKWIEAGDPYVIRFKMPLDTEIVINDIVRGPVKVNTNTLDDKILFKSDRTPTYHFANVIDDHLMGITHVIRGEEWLPSCILHVLIYSAFGWTAPEFCHLPLILGPKGKLSKRDMATLGFSVYPLSFVDSATGEIIIGYREMGILPEAFLNMLAVIGWSPGDNKEVMTLDEMVDLFSLDGISKAGGKFDPKKAEWFAMQHIKNTDNQVLADMFIPEVRLHLENEDIIGLDDERVISYTAKVCGLIKERVPYVSKFWENSSYLFLDITDFPLTDSLINPTGKIFLDHIMVELELLEDFNSEAIKVCFNESIESSGIEPRDAGKLLRAVLCENKVGPPIFDIIEIFGKYRTVSRLAKYVISKIHE